MGEFTGITNTIKRLVLEDMAIMVKEVLGCSILIITTHETNFFEEVLDSFSNEIEVMLKRHVPHQEFNVAELKTRQTN